MRKPKNLSDIMNKLLEYGINIYEYDKVKDKEMYLVWADNLALAYNNKENVLSVAFHVSTKPDDAATIILILKELKNLDEIEVAESFFKDEESQKIISGNAAYNIFIKNQFEKAIKDFVSKKTFEKVLNDDDIQLFNC